MVISLFPLDLRKKFRLGTCQFCLFYRHRKIETLI